MSTGQQLSPDRAAPASAVWAALTVVYLVWGSTYLAIRVLVQDGMPPLLSMGARFVTAAVVLGIALRLSRGPGVLRVTPRQIAASALVGLLLLGTGNGGVALAEATVPSGLAALIVGTMPLWVVLLRAGTGDRAPAVTWFGVFLGFVGIGAISLSRGGMDDVQPWGVALVLFATACWSIGSFISPRLGLPRDALVATFWEMALGGAFLLIGGAVHGELGGLQPAAWSASAVVAWVYLVLAGSLAAYSAYVWLLGNAPLSLVGTYAYVNPVVAVALGAWLLHEPITAVVLGGGALVVVGVALVVSGERLARAGNQAVRQKSAATATNRSLPAGSPTVARTPSSA